MKNLSRFVVSLLLSLPLGAGCFAEDTQKPVEPPHNATPPQVMGKGMMEEQQDARLRAMQDRMLMVHDLSNKILAEQDPVKKEEMKKQQLDLMKSHRQQMMTRVMPAQQAPMKDPSPTPLQSPIKTN
jgi:hypothetical protein